MNCDKKVVENLIKKQLNIREKINSSSYNNQIISAFYNNNFLYKTELKFHEDTIYPLKFSRNDNFMASGSNDGCVAVWNVNETLNFSTKPNTMKNMQKSIINALTFNVDSSKIFSGTMNEHFYIHDVLTGNLIETVTVPTTIEDIAYCPKNSNVISFGGQDGNLYLYDARKSNYELIKNLFSPRKFVSLQYNPLNENILLITSRQGKNFFTLDIRNNKPVFRYHFLFINNLGSVYAKYNKVGDQIFVIRKNYCPVLFNSNQPLPIMEFDEYGYLSSFVFKNCCFAGPNDEFVVSGSDDFNLFVWEIPKQKKFDDTLLKVNNAKAVLKGHRSIVHQICYNYQRSILASSGEETTIKLWSPFEFNKNNETTVNNVSNASDHERILNLDYLTTSTFIAKNGFIFDNSYEKSNIMSLIDYFLQPSFYDSSSLNDHNFKIPHRNYNLKTECLITEFKKDINIYLIKSLIINLRNNKIFKPKLYEVMQELYKEKKNLKIHFIHMKDMSFLFETRKYFEIWDLISYCVLYLLKQSIFLKNQINEINFLKKYEVDLDEKKKILIKINLIINSMISYLLISFLENRLNYSKLYILMKLLLSNLHSISSEFVIKPEIKKIIEKFEKDKNFSYETEYKNSNFNNSLQDARYNNLLDEDLNMDLVDLKKNLKKQLEYLIELKTKHNLKVIYNLDKLIEIFCNSNSSLIKQETN